MALGLGLVGAGIVVGAHLHGATNPTGGRGVVRHPQQTVRSRTAATEEPGSAPTTVGQAAPGLSIDMSQATGETCKPPAAPGPGHPDVVLAQVFRARAATGTSYLLGWQIVPYRGLGTYTLGKAGNLMALEPPAGGRPLGFGKGTVTFIGSYDAGTVDARVALSGGRTLRVGGTWACSAP